MRNLSLKNGGGWTSLGGIPPPGAAQVHHRDATNHWSLGLSLHTAQFLVNCFVDTDYMVPPTNHRAGNWGGVGGAH